MVKIVQMKTKSTGRIRMNLTERLKPLGSCHTTCSPVAVDATKRGRSAACCSLDEADEKHRQTD